MTFANNMDPDKAPQNVGPHLTFKLFDTQIICKILDRNKNCFQILKLACKELRQRVEVSRGTYVKYMDRAGRVYKSCNIRGPPG